MRRVRLLRALDLLAHFLSEVLLLFLDAFANLVTYDRGDFAARLLEILFDRLLVVLHEGLAAQSDFIAPLAPFAFVYLCGDLLPLARGLGLLLRPFTA